MFTAWLALVAILPVLYMPGMGGFESIKSAYLLMVGSLVFVLWCGRVIRTGKISLARPAVSGCALLIALYAFVRTFFVAAPNNGWLGSELSHFGAVHWILWWILVASISSLDLSVSQRRLTRLAATISLIGILAIVAIQQLGWGGINWQLFDDPTRGRTLIGSIGSSGQLGAVLACLLFTIWPLYNYLKQRAKIWQYVWWMLIALTVITILVSKSQTGILLLMIGAGLTVWNHYYEIKKMWWAVMFGLILILPFISVVIPLPKVIGDKVPSWQARTEIWHYATKGFLHHPVFGYGVEQFTLITDEYKPTTTGNSIVLTEEHPHCLVIEILTEWGIGGAVLGGTLIYYHYRSSSWRRASLPALTVWLLAVQTNVLIIPLLLTGLVIFMTGNKPTIATTFSTPKWVGWAAIGLSIPVIFSLYIVGITSMIFSYANDKGTTASANLLFSQAIMEYERPISWPFTRTFTQLEYAEALTNDNIYYSIFTNKEEVQKALTATIKGAPTKRNLLISNHIKNVWRENTSQEL